MNSLIQIRRFCLSFARFRHNTKVGAPPWCWWYVVFNIVNTSKYGQYICRLFFVCSVNKLNVCSFSARMVLRCAVKKPTICGCGMKSLRSVNFDVSSSHAVLLNQFYCPFHQDELSQFNCREQKKIKNGICAWRMK